MLQYKLHDLITTTKTPKSALGANPSAASRPRLSSPPPIGPQPQLQTPALSVRPRPQPATPRMPRGVTEFPEATAVAHKRTLGILGDRLYRSDAILPQLQALLPAIWGPSGSPQRTLRAALLQHATDAWITRTGLIVVQWTTPAEASEYMQDKAAILKLTDIYVHPFSWPKKVSVGPSLVPTQTADLALELDTIWTDMVHAPEAASPPTAMDHSGNGPKRADAPPSTSPERPAKKGAPPPSRSPDPTPTATGGGSAASARTQV
jgi:hypothetical protein